VAAKLRRGGHLADVHGREGEGVQELTRRPGDVAARVGRVLAVGIPVGDGAGGVVDLLAVGRVIPGRARDAHTGPFLVDDVELGEQVEAVEHHVAALELVVADGGQDRRTRVRQAHARVDLLRPPSGVVANLGVEANREVGIAGVDGESLCGAAAQKRCQGEVCLHVLSPLVLWVRLTRPPWR
jgi:hypothetical protein